MLQNKMYVNYANSPLDVDFKLREDRALQLREELARGDQLRTNEICRFKKYLLDASRPTNHCRQKRPVTRRRRKSKRFTMSLQAIPEDGDVDSWRWRVVEKQSRQKMSDVIFDIPMFRRQQQYKTLITNRINDMGFTFRNA